MLIKALLLQGFFVYFQSETTMVSSLYFKIHIALIRNFSMLENKSDSMYVLLQDDNIEAFNQGRENGEAVNLANAKFRAFDLKGANLQDLDLSGAYFKNADLRGQDFRGCNLDGCSLLNAKISGVYFPNCYSADEITLSVLHGTRLRRS